MHLHCRHMYGCTPCLHGLGTYRQESSKPATHWRALSGMQDQVHGCPYKVFGKPQLTAALGRLGLKSAASQAVVAKAQEGHFQLACAAAFEGLHSCACDTGINHPNQVR